MSDEQESLGDSTQEPQGMPGWKKLLLVLAGLFILAGLGLRFAGGADAQPSSGTPGPGGEFSTSLASDSGGGDSVERGASDWSPFFLQGGFGFFLGFSIGLVLRTFFKLFAFGAGLFFLALIGLQYAGVDIPWDSLRDTYDALAGRVAEHADGIYAFVQGVIPATVFSGAGLVAGFKRS